MLFLRWPGKAGFGRPFRQPLMAGTLFMKPRFMKPLFMQSRLNAIPAWAGEAASGAASDASMPAARSNVQAACNKEKCVDGFLF
jgi:hypothetical protein